MSARFELSRIRVTEGQVYSKWMNEIQGKSILVRVSKGSSYRESTVYTFHIHEMRFQETNL